MKQKVNFYDQLCRVDMFVRCDETTHPILVVKLLLIDYLFNLSSLWQTREKIYGKAHSMVRMQLKLTTAMTVTGATPQTIK